MGRNDEKSWYEEISLDADKDAACGRGDLMQIIY
jgi:hypothetical protein